MSRLDLASIPFPLVAVDCIVTNPSGEVLLVERGNPPPGWALPGGFVELGETIEEAVRRELREETGLELNELRQFHVYSDPTRDPRHHMISVVFTARSSGTPRGGDDARTARFFPRDHLPEPLAFDHRHILADFFENAWS